MHRSRSLVPGIAGSTLALTAAALLFAGSYVPRTMFEERQAGFRNQPAPEKGAREW